MSRRRRGRAPRVGAAGDTARRRQRAHRERERDRGRSKPGRPGGERARFERAMRPLAPPGQDPRRPARGGGIEVRRYPPRVPIDTALVFEYATRTFWALIVTVV